MAISSTPYDTNYYEATSINGQNVFTPFTGQSLNASADFLVVTIEAIKSAAFTSNPTVTWDSTGVNGSAQPMSGPIVAEITSGGVEPVSLIYYLTTPNTGSGMTLSVDPDISAGGTFNIIQVTLSSWSGVDQTTPLDTSNQSASTGTDTTVSVTTSDACLVIGSCESEANSPNSFATSFVAIREYDQGPRIFGAYYKVQTGAGTDAPGWPATSTSDLFSTAVGAFITAGGSQSPPTIAADTADETEFTTSTPTLLFTGSDVDSDDLTYEIIISERSDFTGGSIMVETYRAGSAATIHPQPLATATTWEGEPQVDDRPGESFPGHGGVLDKIVFPLSDFQPETDGDAFVRVYAHQGTYGTSSEPLNAVPPDETPTPNWLAKSGSLYFDSTSTTQDYTFNFTGADRIRLVNGTYYVLIGDYYPNSRDTNNKIAWKADNSTLSYGGNMYIDGYAPANNGIHTEYDLWFDVYEYFEIYDKLSASDVGFANQDTPADTDPFNVGDQIGYTVQTALHDGTWYWKVRVKDPSGTNTWSDYTASRSFTVNTGTISGSMGGLGGLTASSKLTIPSVAAIAGTGTLSATALKLIYSQAAMSGAGDLSSTATNIAIILASLSGVGDASASPIAIIPVSSTIIGTGDISSVASILLAKGALNPITRLWGGAIGIERSLITDKTLITAISAILSGVGNVTGSPILIKPVGASPSGVGGLSAASILLVPVDSMLSGVGDMASSPILIIPSAATLSGSGMLSASASAGALISATLSGSGGLSAISLLVIPATAALSGLGDMSSSPYVLIPTSGSMSGLGDMSSSPYVLIPTSGSMSGLGDLSAILTSQGSIVISATITGVGGLTSTVNLLIPSAATLSGLGGASASPMLIIPSSGAMSGLGGLVGTLTTSGTIVITATISGNGTLTAISKLVIPSSSSMTGVGDISSSPILVVPSAGSLTGLGDLSGVASLTKPISSTLSGVGDASSTVLLIIPTSTGMSGLGDLSASAIVLGLNNIAAILHGAGDLSAVASLLIPTIGAMAGVGDITVTPVLIIPSAGSMSGTGSATSSPALVIPASTTMTGTGTLTAAAIRAVLVASQLSGAGNLTGQSTILIPVTSPLAGTGTLSASSKVIIIPTATLIGSGDISAITHSIIGIATTLSGAGDIVASAIAGGLVDVDQIEFTLYFDQELGMTLYVVTAKNLDLYVDESISYDIER